MTGTAPRWLGRTWEYSGLVGIAVSLVAALWFAFAVGPWLRSVVDSLEVTRSALESVEATLGVVDDSLVIFSETLDGVDDVFSETEATLRDAALVTLTTGTLLQEEIPGQIDSLQAAMDGLIDTAGVVDGILSALSFVGVDYDPEVPLDDALADVNVRLGALGESLGSSSGDLFSLTVTVNRLGDRVVAVGESLAGFEEQIEASRQLIADYREASRGAGEVIEDASDRLAGQVWVVRALGMAVLILLVPVFALVWWVGRNSQPGSVVE